jgi:hypothetical protein
MVWEACNHRFLEEITSWNVRRMSDDFIADEPHAGIIITVETVIVCVSPRGMDVEIKYLDDAFSIV